MSVALNLFTIGSHIMNITVGPIFRNDFKKVVEHEPSNNRDKNPIFHNRELLCFSKTYFHKSGYKYT